MNVNEAFAEALKKYVNESPWGSQNQLSKISGVARVTISQILNGYRMASEDVKHKIANALGYSYEEILILGGFEVKNKKVEFHRSIELEDPRYM